MSQKRMIAMIVVSLVMLVGISVMLPATDNSMGISKTQNITLSQPTLVSGALLPAGNYRVTHEMQGASHIMLFKQVGGTAEVKAKCTLVPLTKKATIDEQHFKENAKNQRVLIEMTFRGDAASHVLQP